MTTEEVDAMEAGSTVRPKPQGAGGTPPEVPPAPGHEEGSPPSAGEGLDAAQDNFRREQAGARLRPQDALSQAEEWGALNYLLGTPQALAYELTLDYETDRGRAPLTVVFRQQDGKVIDKAEERAMDQRTGRVSQLDADLELMHEAIVFFEDKTGKQTDPKSPEFRTFRTGPNPDDVAEIPSTVEALRRRFKGQHGLLSLAANEVRRCSGWDRDRVGRASRRLVEAAGG
jgi:hypothetical protein